MSRIANILKAYDSQGIHRTGTEVDRQSADWLAGEIKAIGAEPSLVALPHKRIDPICSELQVGDHTVEGVPLFDCTYTDSEGVTGRLGNLTDGASIAICNIPPSPQSPEVIGLEEARRQEKFKAIVGICRPSPRGNIPGISPINAAHFKKPFGPPVLQVSSEVESWLPQAVAAGERARVTAHVKRTNVTAYNVEARIQGTDATLPPIVVITPRSGWWHCASERGGGIACWLEVLRTFVQQGYRRDVWFLASTGHELGHGGLNHFLHTHPELIQGAKTWIHFGANSAAIGPDILLQMSNPELKTLALNAIEKRNTSLKIEIREAIRPGGEAQNIFDGGGQYLSLLGPNGLFHHPNDRYPDAVDLQKIQILSDAFTEIITHLAQE